MVTVKVPFALTVASLYSLGVLSLIFQPAKVYPVGWAGVAVNVTDVSPTTILSAGIAGVATIVPFTALKFTS